MSAPEDRQGPADLQTYRSVKLWMDTVNKMFHLSEEEWVGLQEGIAQADRRELSWIE